MKTKTFDCVEMKRRAAERIHEALKGMSFEEKLAYWRREDELFRAERERRRQAAPEPSVPSPSSAAPSV